MSDQVEQWSQRRALAMTLLVTVPLLVGMFVLSRRVDVWAGIVWALVASVVMRRWYRPFMVERTQSIRIEGERRQVERHRRRGR